MTLEITKFISLDVNHVMFRIPDGSTCYYFGPATVNRTFAVPGSWNLGVHSSENEVTLTDGGNKSQPPVPKICNFGTKCDSEVH